MSHPCTDLNKLSVNNGKIAPIPVTKNIKREDARNTFLLSSLDKLIIDPQIHRLNLRT